MHPQFNDVSPDSIIQVCPSAAPKYCTDIN